MNKNSKIYVAGHNGLVGSALMRNLQAGGYTNLITRSSAELDLRDQKQVNSFFTEENPEFVFLAAAKVGGIVANNTYRAEFIFDNLQIQNNVIHNSYLSGVKKLLFLGSSCIYPKECPQPMKEEYLLISTLEYTNEPYAIAKIAGIKMCESYNIQYNTNFISVMPTNLYGPGDNYNLEKSHVLPALIRKMHLGKMLRQGNEKAVLNDLNMSSITEAKAYLGKFDVSADHVEIWGSGAPRRELMHSDDMAAACIHIMQNVNFADLTSGKEEIRNTHINIGTGEDISIKELAYMVKEIVGYEGELVFNTNKPDGTMRKLQDVTKLAELGFKASIPLRQGIESVYRDYVSTIAI